MPEDRNRDQTRREKSLISQKKTTKERLNLGEFAAIISISFKLLSFHQVYTGQKGWESELSPRGCNISKRHSTCPDNSG